MNFIIWINTYNRPQLLERFVQSVHNEQHDHHVQLVILNDGDGSKHHGKERYWELINKGIDNLKKINMRIDLYIKTDDDMILAENFFDRVATLWQSINDPKKITLDILSAPHQRGRTLTGEKVPLENNYYKTGWVDMNFVFSNPHLFPTITNCKSSTRSSGVGLWLTRYFQQQGRNMYQADRSLVLHGDHPSQMHQSERQRKPIITTEGK